MNYYISYSIILTDFESMSWLFCSLNRQITNHVCRIQRTFTRTISFNIRPNHETRVSLYTSKSNIFNRNFWLNCNFHGLQLSLIQMNRATKNSFHCYCFEKFRSQMNKIELYLDFMFTLKGSFRHIVIIVIIIISKVNSCDLTMRCIYYCYHQHCHQRHHWCVCGCKCDGM